MVVNKKDHRKVVLLGKSSVGKTSVVDVLREQPFKEYQCSTIGAAYNCVHLDKFKLDIWDTAGQERYLCLSPMYYRDSNIILLVFDVSELLTINRLYYYLNKVIEEVSSDYRCIIIGAKCDLISYDELDRIEKDCITEFSKYDNKLKHPLDYVFISAKDGYNIDKLKSKITEHCDQIKTADNKSDKTVKLDATNIRSNYCSCS